MSTKFSAEEAVLFFRNYTGFDFRPVVAELLLARARVLAVEKNSKGAPTYPGEAWGQLWEELRKISEAQCRLNPMLKAARSCAIPHIHDLSAVPSTTTEARANANQGRAANLLKTEFSKRLRYLLAKDE